ncbi:MAG: hypothetical protein HY547_07040 [Elusimicrobia bacterium]|nr:hypothetical protein [Elusimicrobiota bacterium]
MMADNRFALGIDIGSSGIRAGIYRWSDGMAAGPHAIRAYRTVNVEGGRVEINSEFLFAAFSDILDMIEKTVKKENYRIEAVGLATFWHSLIGLNDNFHALTPLLSWSDTRAAEECLILRRQLPEIKIHQRTGCRIHSCYFPARLLWFFNNHKALFLKIRHWMSLGDYLWLKLFDENATSVSIASATGMFDRRTGSWDPTLMSAARLTAGRLPRIVTEQKTCDNLRKEFKRRWPSLAPAFWAMPIGDGAAQNLGVGSLDGATAVLNVGTSAAIRVMAKPTMIPPELWLYQLNAAEPVLGGALNCGGNLIEFLSRLFNMSTIRVKNEIAQAHKENPTPRFPIALPNFFGERSAHWNPWATGAIFGIQNPPDHRRLLHACWQGINHQLALVYQTLIKIQKIDRVILSGGAVRILPFWADALSDSLEIPLETSAIVEPSARGAALWAIHIFEQRTLRSFPCPIDRIIRPKKKNFSALRRGLEQFVQVNEQLNEKNLKMMGRP